MTTNERDEKWSEWKRWEGGDNPLSPMDFVEIKTRDGDIEDGECAAFYWHHDEAACDIIAYRYKIKEPESDMHPDLEFLAKEVSVWPEGADDVRLDKDTEVCFQGPKASDDFDFYPENKSAAKAAFVPGYNSFSTIGDTYTEAQWLQARKDLGLIMSDEEEEMGAEEWGGNVPEGVVCIVSFGGRTKTIK